MAKEELTSRAGTGRILALDLMRLLAIILVLGRHMEPPPSDLPSAARGVLSVWQNGGGLGVDLFFVLSGFLVSGLMFSEYRKHGNISISRFYLRRAWKIYPSFYFLIGFTYLFHLLILGHKIRDRVIFSEIFFLQSYTPAFWNHTWSLAVEEHFYLVLPLVLLLMVRLNRGAGNPFRAVPYVVAAIAIVCLCLRVVNYQLRADYAYITHVFPSHLRIDSLFFGVAIGYAYHFHADWFRTTFRPRRHWLIGAGAVMLGVAALLPTFQGFYCHTFGFAQYYLGSGALLVGILMCQIPRNRATTALATIGSYSYSIYLWHMALMYWAMPQLRELPLSWHYRTSIYFIGALVIGILAAKLVEIPMLRLRDRMLQSRNIVTPVPPISVPERVKAAA